MKTVHNKLHRTPVTIRINRLLWILCLFPVAILAGTYQKSHITQEEPPLRQRVENYFKPGFALLEKAAKKQPDKKTFRKIMKPLVRNFDGFAEATLLDKDFIIRKTYYKRDVAAVGYDLKKTACLKNFHTEMLKHPSPQISGPTKPHLMQPSVIVLRMPVLSDKKELTWVLSLMIKTDHFLKATGLDTCKACRITCQDGCSICKGKLSKKHKQITVKLPSAEWVIEYEKTDNTNKENKQ